MSSSSSGSGREGDANEKALGAAQAAVRESPWSYDAHEKLIDVLRSAGEFDQLRAARKNMADAFPLPPAMWLAWLNDEERAGTPDTELRSLSDRAVSESYLSVDLWLVKLHLANKEASHSELRRVGELAIASAGLSYDRGKEIWDKYMDYEPDVEKKNRLAERRALVPLRGQAAELQEDFEQWETKLQEERTRQGPFPLGTGSEQLLQIWTAYGDSQSTNPARRINIHERCIAEMFLLPAAWKNLANFLSTTLRTFSETRRVLEQATRNCPWEAGLHVSHIRALEQGDAPDNEVFMSFARSLRLIRQAGEAGGSGRPTTLQIRLALVYFGGRKYVEDPKRLGEICQRALKKLDVGSLEWATVLRSFAEVCFHRKTDGVVEEGRKAMNHVLQHRGTDLAWWLDYVHFEIVSNHVAEARKLFNRGLFVINTVDNAKVLGRSWIDFEEIHGSLHSVGIAEAKLLGRVEALSKKRKDMDDCTGRGTANKRARTRAPAREDVAAEVTNHMADVEVDEGAISEQRGRKERDESKTIFISNLTSAVTKEDLVETFGGVEGFKDIRLIENNDGVSRGFAYADFEMSSGMTEALQYHLQYLKGRKMHVYRSKPPQWTGRRGMADPRGGGRKRGGGVPVRSSSRPDQAMMRPRTISLTAAKDCADEQSAKTADAKNSHHGEDYDRNQTKKLSQADFRSMLS